MCTWGQMTKAQALWGRRCLDNGGQEFLSLWNPDGISSLLTAMCSVLKHEFPRNLKEPVLQFHALFYTSVPLHLWPLSARLTLPLYWLLGNLSLVCLLNWQTLWKFAISTSNLTCLNQTHCTYLFKSLLYLYSNLSFCLPAYHVALYLDISSSRKTSYLVPLSMSYLSLLTILNFLLLSSQDLAVLPYAQPLAHYN